MALALTFLFFTLFIAHIFIGSLGGASLVGDVGELTILIFSVVFFVAAILKAEREANANR